VSFVEKLTDEERGQLHVLKELRKTALMGLGQAAMRYDNALDEMRQAGNEKNVAKAAIIEIEERIAATVTQLAEQKGIREKIEFSLDELS
jgi:hypothetical protein